MRCLLISLLLNVLFAGNAQTYNYYFGNLHAHTGFSDGNKDSLNSGVSRPDGSYTYAKLSNDFDFLGISEHNHYSNNNNPGFEIQNYTLGLNMANNANQDGVFAALFGMEYGVSSNYNGHVIIYGFNQLIGWEPGNYDIYNDKSDYDGLFRKVKNNPNAFCYLAHPYHTDFSTNGSFSGALAYLPYDQAYDSAIVGVPLRSGLAFSQADTYDDYSTGDYISYYRQLLFKGYHLGIGYDHDNHYTNFGRSNGGRLVILAPSLSRANITDAMQNMRFYGSDDSNAKIDFNMNGQVMGSVVQGTVYPTFQLIHNDPDGENADTIKLFRGSANTGTLWAEQVQISTGNNTLQYTDYNLLMNKEYYYYAEIKQHDQQLIVTSPIWYKGLAPLTLNEYSAEIQMLMYPNPSNGQVHLSVNCEASYKVKVVDTLGKEVYSLTCTKSPQVLELEQLGKGVYILEVQTPNGKARRQLKLE